MQPSRSLRQLLQAQEGGWPSALRTLSSPTTCALCQEPETRPGLPTRRGFLCFHPARPETPPEVPLGCLNFKVPRGVLPFQGGGSYRRSSWELERGVGGLERQKKQGGLRTAAPAVAELCATLGGRYLHSVF